MKLAYFSLALFTATLLPVAPCLAKDVDPRIAKIDHWIVICQEGWSFDGLYGSFPNAEGLANAGPVAAQVDRSGRPLATLPELSADPNVAPGLPARPFDLSQFVDSTTRTTALAPRFYAQQLQIDDGLVEPSNGTMDKFVAWSDNPALVMSYHDARLLPEGKLAQQYVLCDHFFQAAFGGPFLNQHYLVAAQAPRWNQPMPARKEFQSSFSSGPGGKTLNDGCLTGYPPAGDGNFAVNATYSAVAPHPPAPADELLRAINNVDPKLAGYTPTIGERLDEAGVAWRWYSGGWADALAGKADKTFQFDRQPLAYYARYAPFQEGGTTLNPKTTGPTAHLQDESQFYLDLAEGKLPAVCFIKPIGALNECPGCAGLLAGQQHAADIVHAVQNSPFWPRTAILVLYADSGGRWDHVPPPKRDKFGPGCRVPALVLSPYCWRGGVQHSAYDTLSILKTLEDRYGLPALCPADAAAASMADCFQAEARAAIDASYTQPDADRPGRWALVVGGTPRADQIHISQEEEWTVVRIHSAGNVTARRSKFRTARLSRIEVYGQGGDDNIQIEERVTLPALLYCGDGNNFVHTGGGPAIVVGGEGDNVIEGGTGRNVLIGGRGRAHLKAGPRGDILVAGWTDYDADLGALRAILKQWAAPDVDYPDRVARLKTLLTPAHVHRGRAFDTLEGGPNRDWFLARPAGSESDKIEGQSDGATVTGI